MAIGKLFYELSTPFTFSFQLLIFNQLFRLMIGDLENSNEYFILTDQHCLCRGCSNFILKIKTLKFLLKFHIVFLIIFLRE